jgi:hypothetical protein
MDAKWSLYAKGFGGPTPLDLVQLPWLCSAELYYDSYRSPVLHV